MTNSNAIMRLFDDVQVENSDRCAYGMKQHFPRAMFLFILLHKEFYDFGKINAILRYSEGSFYEG